MNKLFVRILIAICIVGIGAIILVIKRNEKEQHEAYAQLLSGKVGLKRIEFHAFPPFTNDDGRVMADFQLAFKRSSDVGNFPGQSDGLLTEVTFVLETGVAIRTGAVFFKSNLRFSVYDYSHVEVGEPHIVTVEWDTNISELTRNLRRELIKDP